MSSVATFPALRAHLSARLDLFTACPLRWIDEDYTPPAVSSDGSVPAAWVRADLRVFNTSTMDMEGADVQMLGALELSIYTEKRGGDMRVLEILESFWSLFVPNGSDLDNLNFWAPQIGESLVYGDPVSWYGRKCPIPFTWIRG